MTVKELRAKLFEIENQEAEVVIDLENAATNVTSVKVDEDGNVVIE